MHKKSQTGETAAIDLTETVRHLKVLDPTATNFDFRALDDAAHPAAAFP
jgi:hypothetical protein